MTTLRRRRPGPSDLAKRFKKGLSSVTSAQTPVREGTLRTLVDEFGQAAHAFPQILV